jgi:predicted nucleotidyltransferase
MTLHSLKDLELYFRKEKIFDLLNVNRIGVFGSFTRNEAFNDIDLMIEDDVKPEALIVFANKLKNEIKIPVDVVLSKYAEPIILYRAKQDMKYATRE